MNVTALGDGRYEVITEAGRRLAYGVRRGNETWVFIDGYVWVIDTRGRSSKHTTKKDEAALAAPMPATVVAIHVTAGQAVKTGDVLIVLEAMKMELSVTAPHDGRVTAVGCAVGELVQPGVPLVVLDERPTTTG